MNSNNLFAIRVTQSSGRVGVATKDIIAGNIILLEEPFACVLPAIQHEQFSYDSNEFNALNKIKEVSASKVKGDLCILAYRIMKKMDCDPLMKDLFLELCHTSSRDKSGLYEYSIILSELLRMANIKEKYNIDYLRSIISRISTNAFSIVDDCFDEMGIGIYLKAACFNHSCRPNAFQSFDSKLRISIRALRDIRKNEEITVSYIDLSRPTWWRRSELLDGYNFICNCDRCEQTDYIDSCRCDRAGCIGTCIVQHHQETQYRNWLLGSDCTEPVNSAWHLQYSLPITLRYISVRGSSSSSSSSSSSRETVKHWSDITMACSTCGQDRSASQKKKLSKTLEAICNRYTTLVKQSNQLRSHSRPPDVDSIEDICRQWYALIDLMVESHLPLHHYCFGIVRTSLRNFQEDNVMLLLSHQSKNQSRSQSAGLIVNWRALLGCMCHCYPPEIPSPRFFVEGLRYAQHTLAAIQSSREEEGDGGGSGGGGSGGSYNGRDCFAKELDVAWSRLHLYSLPHCGLAGNSSSSSSGSSYSSSYSSSGSSNSSSGVSSSCRDYDLLLDLRTWLLPRLLREISVLLPRGHAFYDQLDAVQAELHHALR